MSERGHSYDWLRRYVASEPTRQLDWRKQVEKVRQERKREIAAALGLAAAFSGATLIHKRRQTAEAAGAGVFHRRRKNTAVELQPRLDMAFDENKSDIYRRQLEILHEPQLSRSIKQGLAAVIAHFGAWRRPLLAKELSDIAHDNADQMTMPLLSTMRGYAVDNELFKYRNHCLGPNKGAYVAEEAACWAVQPEQAAAYPEVHEIMARLMAEQTDPPPSDNS